MNEVLEFDWHGTSHTKTHAVSHMKFVESKMNKYAVDPTGTDKCSELMWNTGFRVNRDSFDGKAKHRKLTQYNAYTDGSKMEGRTGAGVAMHKGGRLISQQHYRLPDESTVFQAEVIAIKKAAEYLLEEKPTGLKYLKICLLYTSPSPRDRQKSRMPSSA